MRQFLINRLSLIVALAAAGVIAGWAPATAAAETSSTEHLFPTTIALPNGFQPEGIAIGPGAVAYFGSRANGAIYRVSLVTGRGAVINPGPGTQSLGMKTDRWGRLFVSGGSAGDARVLNGRTGEVLASYRFQAAGDNTFVNDVVLTGDAAWYTDSRRAVLYKLPLGDDGQLPSQAEVVHLALTGEFTVVPGATNANGIVQTPDRRGLIIVQSNTGLLFHVDPATGVTRQVDLGGELLTNGDGLLRQGTTLFVVQNRLNTVAKVRLDEAGTSGRVVARATDPRFDIPTTVAAFGPRLYLPNARFSTPPTPDTPYTVVAIPRP